MARPGPSAVPEETFTSQGIVEDTRSGLLDDPKWLSSLYFYDEEGSRLFEAITRTPEYYPTRVEQGLLDAHAPTILAAAGDDLLLAEMGSGSSRKTRTVLQALLDRQGPSTYLPIDVSAEFLADVATRLEADFPGLDVEPVAAEYKAGIQTVGRHDATRRLVLFLGSSIGNFEPDEQVGLLRAAHNALAPGDMFLLGTDLVKDAEVLHAAYNDAEGVTAAFNKNILTHLQRELGGEVDPDAFEHHAFWNPDGPCVEMHLRATRDTMLRFPAADLEVPVKAGETIHTENSYKFTLDGVQCMVDAAGWDLEETWTDDRQWFALHLLRRRET